jgi:hypothetical protein
MIGSLMRVLRAVNVVAEHVVRTIVLKPLIHGQSTLIQHAGNLRAI